MVVAQGEVSNEEKMGRLKQLYNAVKQRKIPSLLVVTKIETADKPLLNSSGSIKEKPTRGAVTAQAPSSLLHAATERPKDVSNIYRSAKVRSSGESHENCILRAAVHATKGVPAPHRRFSSRRSAS